MTRRRGWRGRLSRRTKTVIAAVAVLAWVTQRYGWVPVLLAAVLAAAAVAAVVRVRGQRVERRLAETGEPTVLYRHYLWTRPDIHPLLDGQPIYYGISNRYDLRCQQHEDNSWWWLLVDPSRSTCQTWPNRWAAAREETAAIRADCPVGNTRDNWQYRRQTGRRVELQQVALRMQLAQRRAS